MWNSSEKLAKFNSHREHTKCQSMPCSVKPTWWNLEHEVSFDVGNFIGIYQYIYVDLFLWKADHTKRWKKNFSSNCQKKDPCELYHHGLQQKQLQSCWLIILVALYEVSLSAHSLIFSSLNLMIRTVEEVQFKALF